MVGGHIAGCAECRQEVETLRPVIDSFASWPTDVLRPSVPLWERLAQRIAAETGGEPMLPSPQRWAEPEWTEAASGISWKLLATDTEKKRVSMLVRLAPGTDYPPHRHGGVEELHLLHGELMIGDRTAVSRRLQPGRSRHRRSSCVERDRLHLRSGHVVRRHPSLVSRYARGLAHVPLTRGPSFRCAPSTGRDHSGAIAPCSRQTRHLGIARRYTEGRCDRRATSS